MQAQPFGCAFSFYKQPTDAKETTLASVGRNIMNSR